MSQFFPFSMAITSQPFLNNQGTKYIFIIFTSCFEFHVTQRSGAAAKASSIISACCGFLYHGVYTKRRKGRDQLEGGVGYHGRMDGSGSSGLCG